MSLANFEPLPVAQRHVIYGALGVVVIPLIIHLMFEDINWILVVALTASALLLSALSLAATFDALVQRLTRGKEL